MPEQKRARLARDELSTMSGARTLLTNLPVEILAEILLHTCSPPTVLAVSRTCSFLHRYLAQSPAASFIWRGVRKTCAPVPLPDPGDHWKKTEADYAAFVFDGGVCETCGRITRAMYTSFATRIRLCGARHCQKKFLDEKLVDVTASFVGLDNSLWVPYVECNACFDYSSPVTSAWPNVIPILLRKTDYEMFQADRTIYMDPEEAPSQRKPVGSPSPHPEEEEHRKRVVERCNAAVQRFPEIMELSVRLIAWKVGYNREYKRMKDYNQISTEKFAELQGWDLEDLVASPSFGSLRRRKTSLLEEIEWNDVFLIRSEIESELLAAHARHQRQDAEALYREKLTEVKKIYERLRCGTVNTAHVVTSASSVPLGLPPLSIFCALPSVRVLKGSPDPNAVPPSGTSATNEIKSSTLTMSLIASDVQAWLVPVRKHLMGLLGYPNDWQSASKLTLHPLKRATARFFCRRCGEGEVGRKYQRERCLTFEGVCKHVCVARKGKKIEGRSREEPEGTDTRVQEDKKEKGKKKKGGVKTLDWKVDLFEKDEKAIRLINTMLNLLGSSEENGTSMCNLRARGDVVRCMTCKGWIVMDVETAIGHAHRHETMQIQLLSSSAPNKILVSTEDVNSTIPKAWLEFERGVAGLLLGPSDCGRKLRGKVDYGCKHCFVIEEQGVFMGIEMSGKGFRAMSFNGLRSHVKEKHGIQDVCDEDFFRYSSGKRGDE